MDNSISKSIVNIFSKYFDSQIDPNMDFNESIFGKRLGLDENSLLYLIHIIENEWEFKFTESDFDKENFHTISVLMDCIHSHIMQQI